MLSLLLLLAVSTAAVPLDVGNEKCGYESCTQAEPGVLNVHIVPHTHDDVGWLKTVDQYYYGSRNNIQKAGVQYILDSVIKELWQDPKRRFIYVETAFFWKWWVRQSDDVQHKVHVLVRQGRLQFVGGAWSMNDEAASHYQSTIDQFTWGLRKLNDTFGACGVPRVGWQIDPFGHSREFASLLAGMGYDGLFLGRIDYQDKRARLIGKNMEMIWRGNDDLGKSSDIFTGVLYNNYSPPPGFCFDVLCNDEPIIDDPDSPLFNVDSRINDFLKFVTQQAEYFRTNNTILTMGGDFTYQDAMMWYKNLDKLIEYANMKSAKDGLNIKLFYSTPDCYLKAVKDANPTLPTKRDDFFPYASDPTAYWTGYFTSRPTTKYFERQGNAYLQMAKNLQVLGDLPEHNKFVLDELRSAMGIMQHHDAITGTEKEHVAHDYERILDAAIEDSLIIARQAFNKIAQKDASKPPLFTYDRCRFNESSCPTSENSKRFVVTIYNPVGWDVIEPIWIPVKEGVYEVYAPNGEKIKSQLVDISEPVRKIPTRKSSATHEIVFIAKLHPLGVKSFYIKKLNTKSKRQTDRYYYYNEDKMYPLRDTFAMNGIDSRDLNMLKDKDSLPRNVGEFERMKGKLSDSPSRSKMSYPSLNEEEMRMLSDEPFIVERHDECCLENEFFKLRMDKTTGYTHTIYPGKIPTLDIKLAYWTGCTGDNSNYTTRSSGAYIFRPQSPTPHIDPYTTTHIRYTKDIIVQELRAETAEHAATILRVYRDLNYLEHDFVVGPIDVTDIGKEYIVRYETDLQNDGVFYTDSNGRQIIKRELDKRDTWNLTLYEPIAGNYYPVVNEIYITDNTNRVLILTDRAEGGTSLQNGTIELMLHRRLLHDDAFGVDEPLNETALGVGLVMRGRHKLMNINPNDYNDVIRERKMVLQTHVSPIVFVSSADDVTFESWMGLNNCFRGVKQLPVGVHLLTLEPWRGNTLLMRVENYLDKSDNSTVRVDLGDIFNNLRIKSVKETNLAANRWVEDVRRWEWNVEGGDYERSSDFHSDIGLDVALDAKQIRTFLAEYEML